MLDARSSTCRSSVLRCATISARRSQASQTPRASTAAPMANTNHSNSLRKLEFFIEPLSMPTLRMQAIAAECDGLYVALHQNTG